MVSVSDDRNLFALISSRLNSGAVISTVDSNRSTKRVVYLHTVRAAVLTQATSSDAYDTYSDAERMERVRDMSIELVPMSKVTSKKQFEATKSKKRKHELENKDIQRIKHDANTKSKREAASKADKATATKKMKKTKKTKKKKEHTEVKNTFCTRLLSTALQIERTTTPASLLRRAPTTMKSLFLL